jgi:lariat debranching enzyme
MSKIAFVGDVHGDIRGMYNYLLRWQERTGAKLDGIVHVGDFGVYLDPMVKTDFARYWSGEEEAPIPTIVCPGNHEEYSVLAWWLKHPHRMSNLELFRDGEITTFFGIKIGAIWGNFSYKSWKNEERVRTARRNHPTSPKATHILQSSVEKLKAAGTFDILITHDAPAGFMRMRQPPDFIKVQLGLEHDEPASGCPGFNELYQTGKPHHHFFGHFHTHTIGKLFNTKVICLHCFNYNQDQSVWVMELDEYGVSKPFIGSEIPLETEREK